MDSMAVMIGFICFSLINWTRVWFSGTSGCPYQSKVILSYLFKNVINGPNMIV